MDFDMVVVPEEGFVNVCMNFKAIHEMLDILYKITDMNLMVTLKENNEGPSSLGCGCLYKMF